MRILFAALFLLLCPSVSFAGRAYMVGNSLTANWRYWELPGFEVGDVHYDGGQSLPFMVAHPEEQAELDMGLRWDEVTKEYEFLILQFDAHPSARPTYAEDLAAAQTIIDAIPTPNVLLFTGNQNLDWLVSDYESGETSVNTHTPAYYDLLVADLSAANPGVEFERTLHMDYLYEIVVDPPFSDWHGPGNDGVMRGLPDIKHGTQTNWGWFSHQIIRAMMGEPMQMVADSEVGQYIQPHWADWLSKRWLGNGDVDGNGLVDGFDFLQIQTGASPDPFFDLQNWEQRFGSAPVAAAVVVPEPSGLAIAGVLVCLYLAFEWGHIRGRRAMLDEAKKIAAGDSEGGYLEELVAEPWPPGARVGLGPEGLQLYCPHGESPEDCEACMRQSDVACDAAREQMFFGRS